METIKDQRWGLKAASCTQCRLPKCSGGTWTSRIQPNSQGEACPCASDSIYGGKYQHSAKEGNGFNQGATRNPSFASSSDSEVARPKRKQPIRQTQGQNPQAENIDTMNVTKGGAFSTTFACATHKQKSLGWISAVVWLPVDVKKGAQPLCKGSKKHAQDAIKRGPINKDGE